MNLDAYEVMNNGCFRARCRWLKPSVSTGQMVGDGDLRIIGNCGLLGGTAYDRRCEECLSWEGCA